MKSYLNLTVGDHVTIGSQSETIYEVACFKAFPHGIMVGIYDEPPGKHIDFWNYNSLTKVEPEPEDQPGEGEEYEWISAIADCGDLRWEYKVKGNQMPGRQDHDEEIQGWTNEDIIECTMRVLAVPEHQRSLIQVDFE
jgi:hypothetical protein